MYGDSEPMLYGELGAFQKRRHKRRKSKADKIQKAMRLIRRLTAKLKREKSHAKRAKIHRRIKKIQMRLNRLTGRRTRRGVLPFRRYYRPAGMQRGAAAQSTTQAALSAEDPYSAEYEDEDYDMTGEEYVDYPEDYEDEDYGALFGVDYWTALKWGGLAIGLLYVADAMKKGRK